MACYIYYILNTKNNKVYIGSTSRNKTVRKNEHYYRLRAGTHSNKHLQSAWNKYGETSFEYGIVEECKSECLYQLESHYITITGCYKKNYGYNKSRNAEVPNRGKKWTSEHKDKISRSLKGRRSPMKGRKSDISKINQMKATAAIRRKVINLDTKEIFESVTMFCLKYNINTTSFYSKVGKLPHKNVNFDYYKEVL